MRSVREAFGAPFNWCDRRCERCPLEPECALPRRERQHRWVAQARGLDPDDPDVQWAAVSEDLERLLRMLESIAAEEGVDLNEPLPPRLSVLDAKRLERAAMNAVKCVVELSRSPDPRLDAVVSALRSSTMAVAGKVARIGHYLEEGGSQDSWEGDAVPNLFLLERYKRETRELFAGAAELGHDAAPGLAALSEIDRLLDPMIAEIGEGPRKLLAALQARNAAPSPFCTIEGEQEPTAAQAKSKPHLKLLK
jgi:hypothetical protein